MNIYLDLGQKYKIHYFLEKSPIYDEAKLFTVLLLMNQNIMKR